MAGQIQISVAEVEGIAAKMEGLNAQLESTLLGTKATMDGLRSSWSGEAATITNDTFNAFANKYFESYKSIISAYVKFLKMTVNETYSKTETRNLNAGAQFV